MTNTTPRVYYFISDLHIGGDEALGVCDFEDELIAFLTELASREDETVELLILGDVFGLWEFTEIEGREKLDALIGQFPRIFQAFRKVLTQRDRRRESEGQRPVPRDVVLPAIQEFDQEERTSRTSSPCRTARDRCDGDEHAHSRQRP